MSNDKMKLSKQDIQATLVDRPGWSYDNDAIVRTFTFAGFADAIAFITRLAFDAEAADHHPDLQINYKRVTVIWSTHSEGGVTTKDLDGAAKADAIAAKFGV